MTTWTLDTAHSTIGFKVKHLMISTVRGSFVDFEGTINAPDESLDKAQMNFSAEVASISTNNKARDEHLQSEDFFQATEFPRVTFESTEVQATENHLAITGNLTMRGVTKEIQLKGEVLGVGGGMQGEKVLALDMNGSINREDFGLMWNQALETGGIAVSKEVVLDIHLEAKVL